MKNSKILIALFLCCVLAVMFNPLNINISDALAQSGGTYYVATNGSDTTGDGSSGNPWATISHALDNNNVPDDSLILVWRANPEDAWIEYPYYRKQSGNCCGGEPDLWNVGRYQGS